MSDLISIVIAAYNAEKTLAACIDSALAQIDVSYEIIIIDDFSSDRTIEIAKYYAEKHSLIKYQRLDKNYGPSAARNIGIDISNGDWFAIVDSDDQMKRDRLSKMYKKAKFENADIVLDNMLVREDDKETEFITETYTNPIDVVTYVYNNFSYKTKRPLGYLKPFVRKSFFTKHRIKYNDQLRNSEDFLLILRALICGANLRYLDYSGYIYNVSNGSISAKFNDDQNSNFIYAMQGLLQEYEQKVSRLEKNAIAEHIRYRTLSSHMDKLIKNCKAFSFRGIWDIFKQVNFRDKKTLLALLINLLLRRLRSKTRF